MALAAARRGRAAARAVGQRGGGGGRGRDRRLSDRQPGRGGWVSLGQPRPGAAGVDLEAVLRRDAHYEDDFVDVKGQDYAKRALGRSRPPGSHNVLMIGPPGTGKTLLARRLATIMPVLTPKESLETTRIYSVMGLLRPGEPLMATRPFRSPHHSVSDAGLVGGGTIPQPGEISLAHKGVLFLDELPEFNRKTLEVLRQPLEEGRVTISRALRSTTFPAEFMLVAAMNPCPCGYRSDPRRACTLFTSASGEVPGQDHRTTAGPDRPACGSSRRAVHATCGGASGADIGGFDSRTFCGPEAEQAERFGTKGPTVNGRMTPRQIRKYCVLKPEAIELAEGGDGGTRAFGEVHDKVLRVARTMADLEGSEDIQPNHVAEAVGFRSLDRGVWA